MIDKPRRDPIRVWHGHPEAPAAGAVMHGRQVVTVDGHGRVWWIAANGGEGCSTAARWVEWEAHGDELVKR